ncbi:MAG: tyrosine-protein phosphatase, partial [Pseudomonadota bacterium]
MLPGLPNFRDLGGIVCETGTTRPGLVFRAPALAPLTPADITALEALDPVAIIDLRAPDEARGAP